MYQLKLTKLAYFQLGWYTFPMISHIQSTLRNGNKLTISSISLPSTLLRSDCNFSVWRKMSREKAAIFSQACCCTSLLTFRVSGSPDIFQVWSFSEEGKVTFLHWERSDWGRYGGYGEDSCGLTTVWESKHRCRMNEVTASSVEDPALIISALIALLYDLEYSSVKTTCNIKE